MGRIHEVITRTWQLASKMRQQRGALSSEKPGRGDNGRILRYIAEYTINVARTFGIDAHIGSLDDAKMANVVVWRLAFFGSKPELVIKGGFIALGARWGTARPRRGLRRRLRGDLRPAAASPAAIAPH